MPRVAEDRLPAEPSSPDQKARYRRILGAAAQQGAEKGFERVQMHEVAREAGVAIATLYRYFPSKTHLFAGLMRAGMEGLGETSVKPLPGESPAEGVARLLVSAGEELTRTPLLAHAMIQSNNALFSQGPADPDPVDFVDLMLRAGGIEQPDDHDRRLCRLLQAAWYGIVIAVLNQSGDTHELADDTVLLCRLILGDRDRAAAPGTAD